MGEQSRVFWDLGFAQTRAKGRNCRLAPQELSARGGVPGAGPEPPALSGTGALCLWLSLQGLVPLVLFISRTSVMSLLGSNVTR